MKKITYLMTASLLVLAFGFVVTPSFVGAQEVESVPETTFELCHDSIDNDFDESTDLDDSDCAAFVEEEQPQEPQIVPENNIEVCFDGIDNDDNTLIDASDEGCAEFYIIATSTPEEPEEETPTHSSRSGGSRANNSNVPTEGTVLGAFDDNSACTPYLTSYIKFGQANDLANVVRLQIFLRNMIKSDLAITGTYDTATLEAVNALQLKYSDVILKPWVEKGLMDSAESTGYVYKTTTWFINNSECPSANFPFPILP